MLKKHTKVNLAEANLAIPAGGKKFKAPTELPQSHVALPVLAKLKAHMAAWNQHVGDMAGIHALSGDGAMNTLIQKHSKACAETLAHIATEMETLASYPGMMALMGSLSECKKMEIRRGCLSVTELVEENTHRRLHTQLFFHALDNQAGTRIGQGLDYYKDIMDELVRRLSLFARMGFLEQATLDECITDLRSCTEMFQKKRHSILTKAGISPMLAPQFALVIDDALKLPKHMPKLNQISLCGFDSDASVKLIATNFAAFFDEIACGNVESFMHTYRQKRREIN